MYYTQLIHKPPPPSSPFAITVEEKLLPESLYVYAGHNSSINIEYMQQGYTYLLHIDIAGEFLLDRSGGLFSPL